MTSPTTVTYVFGVTAAFRYGAMTSTSLPVAFVLSWSTENAVLEIACSTVAVIAT